MKTKTLAVLLLIVMIPLTLLGWMGTRILLDEKKLHDHQIGLLIDSQLRAVDQSIGDLFRAWEKELPTIAETLKPDSDSVRAFLRQRPDIRQVLLFDKSYHRIFPPSDLPLSSTERQFLERTGAVLSKLDSRAAFPFPESNKLTATLSEEKADSSEKDEEVFRGWHTWFSGTEMNHLFWFKDKNELLLGFELDPVRLLSSVIDLLPATGGPSDQLGDARIRLLDSRGTVIYQWGRYEPGDADQSVSQLFLRPPLGSWKLEYFGSGLEAGSAVGWFNLIAVLTAVGIALLGLAFYLYKEHTREMKLAEQRVNFVSQVSHELKTPLTNIRLYAELLEDNLPEKGAVDDDEDNRFRKYLEVITSESQRLSRLIANVLNFARGKKDRLILRLESAVVDEIISNTLNAFAKPFESKGVQVNFQAGAGEQVQVDPDALEQILNNIFSNTEKYGASGGRVDIKSRRSGEDTFIIIQDYGPGIPHHDAQKIFLPFYRVSSKLTDGVTGTGIGLSIARDLARLHEGDLTLLSSDKGACLKVQLRTPLEEGKQ